jgi:exopolysaccharide biosynthesis polyprenyl glycosylphosphotransferase
MLDRNSSIPAEKRVQLRSTKKRSAAARPRVVIERRDLLREEIFRAMLALERRRAERSRQPFILMLLDTGAVDADKRGSALFERLASAVAGAIRESDLIGWYEEEAVLAVIFTEVSTDENYSVTEILSTKVVDALQKNLEQAILRKLTLSVHVFPENWDTGCADRVADIKLYPDVSEVAPKQRFSKMVKRGMDIVGSLLLMLVLAPVLAAIAIAIKLTSKGPVIFRQERLGQFGNTFECLKFRTMFTDNDPKIHREYVRSFIAGRVKEMSGSEAGAVAYKIKNDPRVTPVGRFLRRTSLDEFPQFWNVLRGEMSLVGPRPPLRYEFEAYDFWHRRRVLEVKPGVTGLWQVVGRSRTSFDDMVRMDLRYCQKWSLWLDLKILLATPMAVFTGHGAY